MNIFLNIFFQIPNFFKEEKNRKRNKKEKKGEPRPAPGPSKFARGSQVGARCLVSQRAGCCIGVPNETSLLGIGMGDI